MTEAEFVGMLPAIKGKARRFKAVFMRADIGVDDLFQAGACAAWEAATTADDRPSSPLSVFCRKRAGWAMVDMFRREMVHADRGRRIIDDIGDWALQMLVGPDECHETRVDVLRICRAIDTLPADQREVMRRLYADGQGQAEAGAAMGVTQSRVSQIKSQAIAAVRRELRITT